jgi:hypothetical protein
LILNAVLVVTKRTIEFVPWPPAAWSCVDHSFLFDGIVSLLEAAGLGDRQVGDGRAAVERRARIRPGVDGFVHAGDDGA